MTDSEYITEIYNNVFGRTPDAGGLTNWVNQLDATSITHINRGNIMTYMLASAGAAGNTDGERLDNQAAFAVQSILDGVPEATATAQLANITSDDATVTAATAAVSGEAGNALGTTYVLTKGLDALTGTADNDVIIASTNGTAGSDLETMNSLDSIDGSAGIDTLKISSSVAGLDEADLPSLSNVEVIEIAATAALGGGADTFDVSAIDGLTLLKVTRATDAYLEAADTTNVTVAGATGTIEIDGGNTISVSDTSAGDKDITIGAVTAAAGAITVTDTKQGSGVIAVDGGTNVSVTATATDAGLTTTGAIDIGQAADLPTGTITVVQNLEFDGDDAGTAGATTDLTGGDITITGGTVVNVTVNANNVAEVDSAADDIVIGTIDITGDDNTTTVTVTQNDNSEIFSSEDAGGVTETSTVTFGALKSGDSLEVAGLIFTASKDLTGTQVAEAFAGLTATDKQDAGGIVENGIYTGVVNGNWTSAAASGATVVFTSVTANTGVANLSTVVTLTNTSTNSVAPTYVEVAGAALTTTGADSSNAVVLGAVTIADGGDDSIATVTIDGYATASSLASDVLETLTLKNSAADAVFTVDNTTAASALVLNVENITTTGTAEIDLDGTAGTITDLTINATAAASEFILTASGVTDLTINAAVALTLTATTDIDASESIDVNGAGAVNLGNISGATALNSFDASGNTGGVTATVEADAGTLTGDIEEYVFSEGADTVTVKATTGATVDVKISTGAGNDTVILGTAAGINAAGSVIDGGAGTNTLKMYAANAETASGATTFETKISNFSKLSLFAATGQEVVDLANMDDMSYVITAGSTAPTATVTLNDGTAEAGDTFTVTINGTAFTYLTLGTVADDTSEETANALVALINADKNLGVVASAATAATPSVITLTSTGGTLTVAAVTDAAGATDDQTIGASAISNDDYGLTLDNMANDGTLEVTATGTVLVTMTDATGDADEFNIITKVAAGDVNAGAVTVDDVESINLTATDSNVDEDADGTTYEAGDRDTSTVTLLADSVETLTLDGNANITLTTIASTLETITATAMTGNLTYTARVADLVVNAGSGADALTAAANDVTLNGGTGNDTLTANAAADRVILTGGAGNDTFVIAGASTTDSTYANITAVAAGDVIKVTGATAFQAAEVTLSAGATETTQALIAQAITDLATGELGWFQTGGNTFLVLDVNGGTFTAGTDVVVMITGQVELGTGASYNATSNTLEIA